MLFYLSFNFECSSFHLTITRSNCSFGVNRINIIAKNMLTQVDSDGYSLSLMDSIVDHCKDPSEAIPIEEKCITTKSGQRRLCKTMKGWELLIKWKDKSKAWIKLADMKEVHLVEMAEYARARGILNKPAFAWWVPYTLRKREVILAAVKNWIRRMM